MNRLIRTAAVPASLVASLVGVLRGIALSGDEATATPDRAAPIAAEGATLYAASCASCHGAQGAGVPGVFPTLVGNGVVNKADPTKHITVILQGAQGARVDGITYAAPMPGFAAQLTDQQIAAIASYERTAWGNHAPLVTPRDVTKVRAKH